MPEWKGGFPLIVVVVAGWLSIISVIALSYGDGFTFWISSSSAFSAAAFEWAQRRLLYHSNTKIVRLIRLLAGAYFTGVPLLFVVLFPGGRM